MDGAWPVRRERHTQSVQPNVAKMPLLDLPSHRRLAEPMRWQGVELARTAICAIAVREFRRLDTPFGCHLPPPLSLRAPDSFFRLDVSTQPTNEKSFIRLT